MRGLPVFVLLVLGLLGGSFGVMVSDGDYSFSLESVKVLKRLMEMEEMEAMTREMSMEALVGARVAPQHLTPRQSLCSNPTLPQEMKSVCMEPQSEEVFARFAAIITHSDPCEICVNPACTDCVY